MTGLDLGLGDSAVRLNRNQKNDCAADVHAAGEFGIGRRDPRYYGSMDVAGKSRSGAEEETSYEEKRV